MRTKILALAFAVLAQTAVAHDYTVGDISIKHPVSYPTIGRSGAGYMVIENAGAADTLVSVEADFPRVMIHETVETNGVTSMQHKMAVDVPAGESVMFEQGGLHVMFMGLTEHWNVGDEVSATLTFKNAGTLDVVFKVEARPEVELKSADGDQDHSNH